MAVIPVQGLSSFSIAVKSIVVQLLEWALPIALTTLAIIHLVLTNLQHNIGAEMEFQSNCIRRRVLGSKAVSGAILLLLVTYFGAVVHAAKEQSSILVKFKSDDTYNSYAGNPVNRRGRLMMHREKYSRGLLSTDEVKQRELDQEVKDRERMLLRGVKGPRKDKKLGEKTSDAAPVDDIEDDMDVMYGTTQGKKRKKEKRKKKTGLYDIDKDNDGCVCVKYEYEYELLAGKSGKPAAKVGKSQKTGKTKSTKLGGKQCIKYSCIEEVQ